jgi:hypothetical protein
MNSRYRSERRQPPYYLLTGLILGLVISLATTMVFIPIVYSNVPPETLNNIDKDQYRLTIARAYQANHDSGRALARLGLLRDENVVESLIQQAQRSELKSDAQTLLFLYEDLQKIISKESTTGSEQNPLLTATPQQTLEVLITAQTEIVASNDQAIRTATPLATLPLATNTPISVAEQQNNNIPFRLEERKEVCNPSYDEPLIQIEVFNRDLEPLPNTRVIVTWEGGQDLFYTGFYPEISSGYADFSMKPNTIYNVKVGDVGELIQNISAPPCKDDAGNAYWGSIYLRFIEP